MALWIGLTGTALTGCSQPEQVDLLDDRPALVSAERLGGAAALPSRRVFGEPPEGLQLRLAIKGDQAVFEPGATIPVEAKLVNSSGADIDVALPGDGSHKGWREPEVRFSADRREASGGYAPMKAEAVVGCGNYDNEWQDDLGVVPAGGELPLKLWASPGMFMEFYQPGDHRLFVHYEYARGHWRRSGGPVPDALKDTPAFKLVSNAVALRVEEPLTISIEVLGPVESGEGSTLSDVIAVRVHNHSNRPRTIGSPFSGSFSGHSLWLRTEDHGVREPQLPVDREAPAEDKTLAPGETLTLIGPDAVFASAGGHWTVEKSGKIRLRASYHRDADNYRIRSDWVTIEAR